MSKRDDALHFDFSRPSQQAPVGLNSAYWGTYGALLAPLFPVLGFDILWNGGFMKPIAIFAPEGSLVNCRRPAPNRAMAGRKSNHPFDGAVEIEPVRVAKRLELQL